MGGPISDSAVFSKLEKRDYLGLADVLLVGHEANFLKRKGQGIVTRDSLAAYIGELDRGYSRWWRRNPAALARLTEVLRLDKADLGIHDEAPTALQFNEFPALRALAFEMGDVAWSIGEPQLVSGPGAEEQMAQRRDQEVLRRWKQPETLACWLDDRPRMFGDRPLDWLHVKDPLEFRVLLGKLGAAWRRPVLTWTSVADGIRRDMARLQNPAPLIIALHAETSAVEVVQLDERRGPSPLLVVSRHPLPSARASRKIATDRPLSDDQSEKELAPMKEALDKVRHWSWKLVPDWQTRVIDWTVKRVSQTTATAMKRAVRLNAHDVQDLLRKVDAAGVIFEQPADILGVCNLLYTGKAIPPDELTPERVDEAVLERLAGLSLAKRDRIRLAIRARWNQWEVSWEGALSESQWEIVAGGAGWWAKLKDKELVATGTDRYDFKHPLIAKLIFRQELRRMLESPSVACWAQGAFDPQRRALLDSTLQHLERDKLAKVAECLGNDTNTAPALKMAAAEALFVAVGRKIARGDINLKHVVGGLETRKGTPELRPPWRGLVAQVLEHLSFDNEPALPWTRPFYTPAEQLEWATACWTWSMAPAVQDVPATWLFPGWARTELSDDMPQWMDDCISRHEQQFASQPDAVWFDFVCVLQRWLGAGNDLPKLQRNPIATTLAWICPGEDNVVRDSNGRWYAMLRTPWAERVLIQKVENLPQTRRLEVAKSWWPNLVALQKAAEDDWKFNRYSDPQRRWNVVTGGNESALLTWVAGQVKAIPSAPIDSLDKPELVFLINFPGGLPKSLKLELLAWLAQRPDLNFPRLKEVAGPLPGASLFWPFGSDAVDGFVPFLSSSAGEEVARLLWLWQPDQARSLMLAHTPAETIGKQYLLLACPRQHLADAVDALRRFPQVFTGPRIVAWARWHLPHAGVHALALMELLKQEPSLVHQFSSNSPSGRAA